MREEHIKDRVTLNTVEEDMASTAEADERAALLDASRRAPIPTYEANPEGEARRQPGGATSFEFLALLKHSYPVILSYILQNSIQTISIFIAGYLGSNELSVTAFSLMLAFVTGEYSTFDTLFPA